jgi:hypothetical protein
VSRRPSFAAIIGHADDPDMLRRCIAHHLEIGVERIFVSLNDDDPQSASVANEFAAGGRVRAARVESFAPDPFHYFTAAKDVVMAWAAPDWVLFLDSDEFWVPAGGDIADTAGLAELDLIAAPRYNVVPLRERDGTVREVDLADPAHALLIAARRPMDAAYLARKPHTPWILVEDARKIMTRPELVREVGRGAHDIVATTGTPRWAWPDDLLIAHAPFTTEARFRRKVDAIRTRLTAYGNRFGPTQAWHWRRWLQIDDAGGLAAEFALQLFDARHVPALLAAGELTTPARLFVRDSAACG